MRLPTNSATGRIFYCPTHGRVTVDEAQDHTKQSGCDHCYRFFTRKRPFKAKWSGES